MKLYEIIKFPNSKERNQRISQKRNEKMKKDMEEIAAKMDADSLAKRNEKMNSFQYRRKQKLADEEAAKLKSQGKFRDELTGEVHDLEDIQPEFIVVLNRENDVDMGISSHKTRPEAEQAVKEYMLQHGLRNDDPDNPTVYIEEF